MKKPLGKIKDLLAPTDGIALAVIVIGLLIAIFLQRAEIRLIGVSVAILGMVAFFMLISQRLKDLISSSPFKMKPPADLTVTEKHDVRAKRQVIEGFENSFGDDSSRSSKNSENAGEEEDAPKFAAKHHSKAEEAVSHQYEEEISGVRIIGKKSLKSEKNRNGHQSDSNVKSGMKNVPVYADKSVPSKAVISEKIEEPIKIDNDNKNYKSDSKTVVPEQKVKPEILPQINADKKEDFKENEKRDNKANTLFDFADEKQNKKNENIPVDNTRDIKAAEKIAEVKNTNISEKKKSEVNSKVDLAKVQEAEVKNINPVESNIPEIEDNFDYAAEDLKAANLPRENKTLNVIIKKNNEPDTEQTAAPNKEKSEAELKQERLENYKKNKVDVPISLLVDDTMLSEEEPRKQFEAFLTRVLMIIRSMASTNTVAFLLVNMEKDEIILESYVTDIPDAIIKGSKIKMGNDVISQIVNSSKPEILTEINPAAELDLIPYYSKPVGCSSFIGVPVFYKNSVMGIICADTDIPDAYDTVTIGFLGHFTKLISGLTLNYTEKHELLQASKSLEVINIFRQYIASSKINIPDISLCAIESIAPIFDYTNIGICTYDDTDGSWRIFALKNKNDNEYVKTLIGVAVDLKNTLIGDTILNGRSFAVDINEKSPIRVHKAEMKMNQGYFVSVPLNSVSNNYGALFLELRSRSGITNYDLRLLEMLAEHTGSAIEQVHLTKLLNTSSIMDPETGILNAPAFYMRLNEELSRCKDFKNNITLFAFKIDNYAAFNSEEHVDRLQKVIFGVIEIMKKHIKGYDIFGKIERETFGVGLYGLSLTDAQLWAERVRSDVAKNVININSKKFSVTISGGLASAGQKDTAEDIIQNVKKVLDISLKKTNCVSIFA